MIMEMADAAMKEAERSGKSGADKKQMVIDTVKAGCKAAGVNLDDFIDQLSAYIDDTIKFVNEMKK
jgi:enamine deaminase RidA (YjgF/YER057c/UK114 family)